MRVQCAADAACSRKRAATRVTVGQDQTAVVKNKSVVPDQLLGESPFSANWRGRWGHAPELAVAAPLGVC